MAIVMIVLAIINIGRKLRQNSLLTATGGLHVNFLIFYGVGPLSETYGTLIWDVFNGQGLKAFTNEVLMYVTSCYLVYTIYLQVRFFRRSPQANAYWFAEGFQGPVMNAINGVFLILSVIGYLFAQEEFALSGVGTIFPVLKNLLFPCVVTLIYNTRTKDFLSVLLLLAGFLMIGINAFYSSWRSELVLFIFSIGMGLVLRNRRYFYIGLIAGPLLVALILPFQFLKKSGKVKDSDAMVSAFTSSLQQADGTRSSLTLQFISFRLNYAREAAYVRRGLDYGYLDYRYGDTYQEMVLQLIPRVVWPEKPSYNHLANRVIPRKIGLLHSTDPHTSWGVNYFAEFMYNFPIQYLPLFFIFYFWILGLLDRLTRGMAISPHSRLLLQITLFFQVLTTVTLGSASTYFLWIFIVVKLIDTMLYPKKKSTMARKPVFA